MLNYFSCPFQQWNQTSIPSKHSTTKPLNIEPTAEVNQQILEAMEKQSKKYFGYHLNAEKYRSRMPEDHSCNFQNVVNTKYQDIRTAVNQSIYFTRAQPVAQQALRYAAISLQAKRYDNVIKTIDRLMSLQNPSCLGPIYSFIASILQGSFDTESKTFYQLEHVQVPQKDLPHFFHLLDELITLQKSDSSCLIKLLFNDIQALRMAFNREPHIMPLLNSKSYNISRDPLRPSLDVRIQLNSQKFYTVDYLLDKAAAEQFQSPYLRPALEIPRSATVSPLPKDTTVVGQLITLGKYAKAVAMATSYIQAGIKFPEMYMYRALALFYLNHIPGAILDMTRSIELEPTYEKYKARAAFWLAIGDKDMSKQDMNALILPTS